MTESIFDPSWYRVASLRPALRMHGQLHKHKYRNEVWYILQDHASNRFNRFTPEAYYLIRRMDGNKSVQDLFDMAAEHLGDDAPTQGETIQLLGQLHAADMLQCDIPPDTSELFRRYQQQKKQKLTQTLKSPLAIRIPLFDPDQFLQKYSSLIKPLVSMAGLFIWITVVVSACILAIAYWPELTDNVSDRVLAPHNLALIWFIFPVIKILHELGHGFATKIWGGEVHEIGIMLLVFMPVPYVDATSASAFNDKYKRIVVGAAGMIVEVFIASIAMFLWLAVEPGMVKSIAFNVMLIAGVSTVLFNGNPLLRFDGYYIFSDMIEIPNLGSRANRYFFYLIQKYIYSLNNIATPVSSNGEARWFLIYSISSFIYRMLIYFSIILFISGKYFFVGILLSIWAIYSMFITPLYKGILYLLSSNDLDEKRLKAISYTSSFVAAIFIFLFAIPFPWHTFSEGVIWEPERSIIRSGASSFIDKVLVKNGESVEKGQALIICKDEMLSLEIKKKKYELMELESQQRAFKKSDRVQVDVLKKDIERAKTEYTRLLEQQGELIINAPEKGEFYASRISDLPGKYFSQGEPVAYVMYNSKKIIRVVVPQNKVDLVRNSTESVEVKYTTNLDKTMSAKIIREVPAGSKDLPRATLAGVGGGEIAIDPRQGNKLTTFERVFQFDVEVFNDININNTGSRVYVRFYHGLSPLAYRWYKSLKQLLLRRFNV